MVAPYKVFDKGVERTLIKTKNNKDVLLVTYTSGGSTPGDSYLWLLDDNEKPNAFKIVDFHFTNRWFRNHLEQLNNY